MQQRVYQKKIDTVDELKQRLVDVWQGMQQSVLDNAIDEWRKRLRACIRKECPFQRRTFSAYAVTVDSTCITSFVSCVLLLVKSRISEHSVAIDLLKLNIFNRTYFQALL